MGVTPTHRSLESGWEWCRLISLVLLTPSSPFLLGETLKAMQGELHGFLDLDCQAHWQATVHLPPGQCVGYTAHLYCQLLSFPLYTSLVNIQLRVMAAPRVLWWLTYCQVYSLGQEMENMRLPKEHFWLLPPNAAQHRRDKKGKKWISACHHPDWGEWNEWFQWIPKTIKQVLLISGRLYTCKGWEWRQD